MAGFAAILLPGAGHYVRGERKRGLLIALGILGLFFGGMLIGGIDVVDSDEDAPWFIGQALVGPVAFGVDYLHQHHFKVTALAERTAPNGRPALTEIQRSAFPHEGRDESGKPILGGTPPNIKSLSKVNELGTLFGTIAGMLNVIAVLDAALPTQRRRKTSPEASQAAPAPVGM